MVEQGLYTGLVGRESADEKHGRPPNVIILGLYHWQQMATMWNRSQYGIDAAKSLTLFIGTTIKDLDYHFYRVRPVTFSIHGL